MLSFKKVKEMKVPNKKEGDEPRNGGRPIWAFDHYKKFLTDVKSKKSSWSEQRLWKEYGKLSKEIKVMFDRMEEKSLAERNGKLEGTRAGLEHG